MHQKDKLDDKTELSELSRIELSFSLWYISTVIWGTIRWTDELDDDDFLYFNIFTCPDTCVAQRARILEGYYWLWFELEQVPAPYNLVRFNNTRL